MDYQIAQEDRLSKQQENQQERMVKMKEQDVRLKTAEIAADAKIKAEKIKLANPTAGEKPNPSKIKSAKNIKLEK